MTICHVLALKGDALSGKETKETDSSAAIVQRSFHVSAWYAPPITEGSHLPLRASPMVIS